MIWEIGPVEIWMAILLVAFAVWDIATRGKNPTGRAVLLVWVFVALLAAGVMGFLFDGYTSDTRAVLWLVGLLYIEGRLVFGRYTQGGAPARPGCGKARDMSRIALRYNISLMVALFALLVVALLLVLLAPQLSATLQFLRASIEMMLFLVVGTVLLTLFLPPIGLVGIAFLLTVSFQILCFVFIAGVLLVLPPCVLGIRAMRAAAEELRLPKAARVVYTIFLLIPAVNIIPLVVLRAQLRKAGV